MEYQRIIDYMQKSSLLKASFFGFSFHSWGCDNYLSAIPNNVRNTVEVGLKNLSLCLRLHCFK